MPRKIPRTPEEQRAYYQANKERICAANRAYRLRHPDRVKATKQAYYETHKEEINALRRATPSKDPEKKRAYMRAYHAAHKGRYVRKDPEKRRAKERAEYQSNPEIRAKKLAFSRAYRLKQRDRLNAKHRRYAEAHKERLRAYRIAYYAAHNDTIRLKGRIYRKVYKAVLHERNTRNRIRRMGIAVRDFTAAQWQAMKKAAGYRCTYCGKKTIALTQDHITPLIKGGQHTLHNIVPACQSCNSSKNAGPPPVPTQPFLIL